MSQYKEGPESTFQHLGKIYQLDPLLEDVTKLPVKQVHTKKLLWNLQHGTPDPVRLKNADTKYPIIITDDPKYGLVILDGFHRFCKQVEQNKTTVSVKIVPIQWLERYQLSLESFSPITVGQTTVNKAQDFLEALGVHYSLPALGAINYSNVPHQYTFAYQNEQPVGILITTTLHNDYVALVTYPDADYKLVGTVLLNSLRVTSVLARTDDSPLNLLLEYAGYRLAERLVKFNLYRKAFPANQMLSIQ